MNTDNTPKDKLAITKIMFGTVIDHIPNKMSFKISSILNLQNSNGAIAVIASTKSRNMGKKDIIKIEGRHLNSSELDKIALLAPGATINIIDDSKVISKTLLSTPAQVSGILKCFNPNCITNHEKTTTKFKTVSRTPLKIRCFYCERTFDEDILERMIK